MTPPLPLRFVLSAPGLAELPDSPAEVALVGRSNVGKSSLVNALARRRNLAQTSKTPGRTRLLNCYELGDGSGTLVDCPGFGYAAASGATRQALQRMTRAYLAGREQLAMVVLLVDGEIGPTPLDLGALAWLRAEGLPLTIVASKHDKVKSSRREKRKRELAEQCGVARGDVVWVSAAKDVGIDRLRGLVHQWLAGA